MEVSLILDLSAKARFDDTDIAECDDDLLPPASNCVVDKRCPPFIQFDG